MSNVGKTIKRIITKPVYLFGEDKEDKALEEKLEAEMLEEDKKAELKWHDRYLIWPFLILTWITEAVMAFVTDGSSLGDIGQIDKPRKLKTAINPLVKLFSAVFYLFLVIAVVIGGFLGIVLLCNWLVTLF